MAEVKRLPKYRKHKNGQAFIQYKSKRHYLGVYGSEESQARYREWINRILSASHEVEVPASPATRPVSIAGLIVHYTRFAKTYYSDANGPTKECNQQLAALRVLDDLYGTTDGSAFGPGDLDCLQQHMVGLNWSRTYINSRISRIKRFFRWCSKKGLIPPERYHALLCVDPLRMGRSGAREAPKVRPVSRAIVDLTIPWLSPTVAAMVQSQLLCGMRPGEVCIMRACDINMTGDIWLYTPGTHKNAWRGQSRVVAIPKAAQEIIEPILPRNLEQYIFSPRDSERWRRERLKASSPRKTKRYQCEIERIQRERERRGKRSGRRVVRDHYNTSSYRRAITYAIERAEKAGTIIPRWHPHQLRHTISTEISQTLGQQASQRWLGHENLDTTAIYTELQVQELIEIARRLDERWSA